MVSEIVSEKMCSFEFGFQALIHFNWILSRAQPPPPKLGQRYQSHLLAPCVTFSDAISFGLLVCPFSVNFFSLEGIFFSLWVVVRKGSNFHQVVEFFLLAQGVDSESRLKGINFHPVVEFLWLILSSWRKVFPLYSPWEAIKVNNVTAVY